MTALDLNTLHLGTGHHSNPEAGMCLLEATALFSGEPFTDHPACVSPVLTSFGIRIYDRFGADRRQQLKRFIPLLPGTAGDGFDETRGYLAVDWLVRTYTPEFLALRPELAESAAALRGLPEIVDLTTAKAAGPIVRSARAAAWAAAWAAARDAAWAAAGHAAGAADWDSAGHAAWAAARDAAWDAARAAAGAAARDAAWDAAWAAARDAAGAVLQPTVDLLQDSAIDLFAAMINPTREVS